MPVYTGSVVVTVEGLARDITIHGVKLEPLPPAHMRVHLTRAQLAELGQAALEAVAGKKVTVAAGEVLAGVVRELVGKQTKKGRR